MRKNILLTVASLGLAAMMMSGCASTSESMVKNGYGPVYSQGYGDGCKSGKNAAGSLFDKFTKNINLFQRDKKYAMGWKDGYSTCRSQWKEMSKDIDNDK